jgi:hypothetical protein
VVTEQYVRREAYIRSVAQRHRGCRVVPETFAFGNAGKSTRRPRQIIPEGGAMSNVPAVTMQDLELEQAELLPSREIPWCCKPYSRGGGSSVNQLNTASATRTRWG